MPAALILGKFLFCLNKECGVVYARTQRSERLKLATLGVDSRSTATTILAVRALLELQSDRTLSPEARRSAELHGQSAGCIAAGRPLQ